jgi:hypothetical protein
VIGTVEGTPGKEKMKYRTEEQQQGRPKSAPLDSWFAAALVVFTLSSIISKALSLPVYKRVIALEGSDSIQLGEERLKLQAANNIRAVLCTLSLVLMAVGMG